MPFELDLSSLPCGVVVVDHKNKVVFANTLVCEWLGYSQQDLFDKAIATFLPPASKLLYLGHILPKLQTMGLVEEKYLQLKTAAGSELPVLLNAQKIQQGADTLFVLTLVKMLRRHLIEEHLIAERRLVELTNAEKDKINQKLQEAQADLLAKQTELVRLNEELTAFSITDALTGLFNRRYFDKKLSAMLVNLQRLAQPFALVLLDIDFFKTVNDTYGHNTGDLVLQGLAAQLSVNIREIDFISRLGGEEFAIILPGVDLSQAKQIAERYRQAVEVMSGFSFNITASFGVTLAQAEDSNATVYQRADRALYHAKTSGRNKVSCDIDISN